jgi:hypothetical protein
MYSRPVGVGNPNWDPLKVGFKQLDDDDDDDDVVDNKTNIPKGKEKAKSEEQLFNFKFGEDSVDDLLEIPASEEKPTNNNLSSKNIKFQPTSNAWKKRSSDHMSSLFKPPAHRQSAKPELIRAEIPDGDFNSVYLVIEFGDNTILRVPDYAQQPLYGRVQKSTKTSNLSKNAGESKK